MFVDEFLIGNRPAEGQQAFVRVLELVTDEYLIDFNFS